MRGVDGWAEAPPADAAQVLDAALADRSFLAAERLTLADVACYVACKQAVAGASAQKRGALAAPGPGRVPTAGPQSGLAGARVSGPPERGRGRSPRRTPMRPRPSRRRKQPEKPKAPPADTKKKEKKPKAPKPAKAPPAPAMPEPSTPGGACEQAAPCWTSGWAR